MPLLCRLTAGWCATPTWRRYAPSVARHNRDVRAQGPRDDSPTPDFKCSLLDQHSPVRTLPIWRWLLHSGGQSTRMGISLGSAAARLARYRERRYRVACKPVLILRMDGICHGSISRLAVLFIVCGIADYQFLGRRSSHCERSADLRAGNWLRDRLLALVV